MEKVVVIERPVAEIFDYVVDCDNSKDYLGANFNFRAASPAPYGVGSKAVATGSYMGINIRLDYTVVEYVPNKLLRLVCKDQPLNGIRVDSEACWRFAERGHNRTAVGFRLIMQPRDLNKFGAVGTMVAMPIISAAQNYIGLILEKAMTKLKQTLEKGQPAAA